MGAKNSVKRAIRRVYEKSLNIATGGGLNTLKNHLHQTSSDLNFIKSDLNFIKTLLLKQNAQNLGLLFDTVYETNMWGKGSGSGSDAALCADYVAFLQEFFAQYAIKSVVDCGCGDWQFSQNIDFDGISYDGFDVASFVIRANNAKFARENVRFKQYDGDFSALPGADLLICKDVLMHLPIAKIHDFIAILPRFKYALITNCNGRDANGEILATGWRYLDLRRAPFNLKCEVVFEILEHPKSEEYFGKQVMLWRNDSSVNREL